MNVDIRRLRTFVRVVDEGSINRAAAALTYTPSAVSQQLSKLERQLDTVLLERSANGVVTTPAGQRILQAARRVLAEVDALDAEVMQQSVIIRDTITLAAFPTAARSLAIDVVLDLAVTQPCLRVIVHELEPDRSVRLLAQGQADVAMVHQWKGDERYGSAELRSLLLGWDTVDVVVAASHPLAHREEIDLEDCPSDLWITSVSGSIYDRWLLDKLEQTETPHRFHRVNEFATQLRFVGAGIGIALLPRLGRGPLAPEIRPIRLHNAPQREILAVWRRGSSARPSVSATLDSLRNLWPGDSGTPEEAR